MHAIDIIDVVEKEYTEAGFPVVRNQGEKDLGGAGIKVLYETEFSPNYTEVSLDLLYPEEIGGVLLAQSWVRVVEGIDGDFETQKAAMELANELNTGFVNEEVMLPFGKWFLIGNSIDLENVRMIAPHGDQNVRAVGTDCLVDLTQLANMATELAEHVIGRLGSGVRGFEVLKSS